MKKMKSILPAVAMAVVMAAAMLLAGCGSDSGAMQITAYAPDKGEQDLYALVNGAVEDSSIFSFDAGPGVKSMMVGYDVYENGKKISDEAPQFALSAEKDESMNGLIGLWFGDDKSAISTSGTNVSSVSYDTPWKKYEDAEGWSWVGSGCGGEIVKGEKTYIYGRFYKKGDSSEIDGYDLDYVLSNKSVLKEYDKSYMFYVIFK